MSNKTIDKMALQFTSLEELQAYCDSQYKTIITLNQRLQSNETELEKLRNVNEKLKQEQMVATATNSISNDKFKTTDEETICVIQIAMLKQTALERELSMDETKKLDTFVKVLLSLRAKDTTKKPVATDNLTEEQMLEMMGDFQKTEPQ